VTASALADALRDRHALERELGRGGMASPAPHSPGVIPGTEAVEMGSPRLEIFVRQRATGLFGDARRMPPGRSSTGPNFLLRCGTSLLVVGLALMLRSGATLWAQGATGAAVQGTISGTGGVPVADATVLITNTATGERWRTYTHTDGRFLLDHLSIGGPYRLEVNAIGFEPAQREGMFLSLGERLTSDFGLTPAAFQLAEVSVQAEPDPRINAGRTGPAMTVRESTIVRLPVDGRDYTRLALLSPLVTPTANDGLSFAGQHDRLNSLQVDGTTDNNLSGGLGDGIFGIPGGQTSFGLFALTPEAVAELQVMAAPFDVRYGNFAGGLVNAVSRSGSNRWQGSIFGYFDSPGLSGTNPDGSHQDPFSRQEYGFTLGGPIVRDRVAFFLSGDARRQVFPRTTFGPGRDTTGGADSAGVGIRYATVTRFQEILAKGHGVDAGTYDAVPSRVPTRSLFAKVSAQLGINSRLEVSHDHFWEGPWFSGEHDYGFLGFLSHGSYDPRTVDATRLDWTAAFGSRWTNQLLLARRSDHHLCSPLATFPTVEVAVDAGTVIAGEQEGCRQDNYQSIWELTDNLELTIGPHHLTLGTHDELIHIYDGGGLASHQGYWFFTSLDSLEQSLPEVYTRFVPGPLPPTGGRPDFKVNQVGFYVQDQWLALRRLTVTGGLRFDVPFLTTTPPQNPELLATLGLNTARVPSGQPIWSPRLGVNYDLSGRGTAYLRGGIGLFAGRPAYAWLENAYDGAGLGLLSLVCSRADGNVPAFTLDETAQPSQCADIELPIPQVTVFNPGFRYPRNLKVSLGADARLAGGWVGTVDLLYTQGVNQFAQRDLNLLPPSATALGEDGRVMYGTIDPASGFSSPNRRTQDFGSVVEITNGSGDRAYSLSFQLQRRFVGGTELGAGYAYTDAKNRTDSPGTSSRGNLGNSPLDRMWEQPNLRDALWDHPHRLTLFAAADLPLELRVGLVYLGYSGDPFTYIVEGDANADGLDNVDFFRHNDPAYVPRDADDITLEDPAAYPMLEQYIQGESCLSTQRGRLLARNSCRNPWINRLDARLTKVLPTGHGHSLQLTADMFNLLNFIDHDWGQVRRTLPENGPLTNGNRVSLVELVGYDAAKGRGVYKVLSPRPQVLDVEATRWRMQLSVRYAF
jgi:hypothetical protein